MVAEQQEVMTQLQKVIQIFTASNGTVRPHFILTGPSGSGKSHLAQSLSEMAKVNYFEVNAAQLTKEGTAGNSLSKALVPLMNFGGQPTICFVDEWDKLFISGNNNSELAHEVTNGVQNEFLKVLESDTASVFGDYGKYNECSVGRVLFIFAGAFNGEENITIDRLRNFGIKTEFLGRVGLVYNLKKLSLDSMHQALLNNSLLANYLRLFPEVDKSAVVSAVMNCVAEQHDKNTLGIRLLNTLLHQYFINGGRFDQKQVQQTTFQSTLDFEPLQLGAHQ